MSLLLQISLAFVFLLWILPIIRGIEICFRSITRLFGDSADPDRGATARLLPKEDERDVLRPIPFTDDRYQELRNEVIRARALLNRSLDTQLELEEQIRELEEIPQHQEAAVTAETIAKLRKEIDELAPQHDALRAELADKESALQKAYPLRPMRGAATKTASAVKKENHARIAKAVQTKIDFDVKRREEFAKETRHRAQILAHMRLVIDAVEKHAVGKRRIEELKVTMETSHREVETINAVLAEWESNEDFLSEKLATFETGNEALQRRVEEAAQRDDLEALDEAEMLLLEREVQASKFKLLLEDSIKQRTELKELGSRFEKVRIAILKRIVAIEPNYLDFRVD